MIIKQILGMFIYRPYVFVFFGIYLFAAARKLGRRQVLVFTAVAYLIAFLCEFCSTRIGFPFGLYHYIETTRDRELWIANVPFWDSLSFTFLCYLGWRLGMFLHGPLLVEKGDLQVVDSWELRGSLRVLVSGAVLVTLLDVVIDPLTVRGDRWFLGQIYFYPQHGIYFGVPVSNFLGWMFVAGVTIWCYQRLDRQAWMDPGLHHAGVGWVRWGGMVEPLLYLGIFLFNLIVTLAIGEKLLGLIDLMIFSPVLLFLVSRLVDPRVRVKQVELELHENEFPVSCLRRERRVKKERG